jgi:hypothetical protein
VLADVSAISRTNHCYHVADVQPLHWEPAGHSMALLLQDGNP